MITKRDYYERFKGKTCKMMPRESSKQDLLDVHKIKMEMKRYMRNRPRTDAKPHILANISRHHENYGETPQENELRMREKSS